MANVVLDTNIYGKMIEDKESIRLIENIISKNSFIIHDFRIIRDELRRAPKILPLYDKLVKTKVNPDTREIHLLAEKYHMEYRKNGGKKSLNNIRNDFKIVAFASIKNCDLVFSDDNKTLKADAALRAYRLVNLKIGKRTPTFYSYNDLKRTFL